MTGPFVDFGDIGEALELLSAPGWVYALAFAVGIGGTVLLLVTRWLLELTDPNSGELAVQLRSLGLFAWLIGSAVVIAAGGSDRLFTPVGAFEVLGALTIGIFLVWVPFFMRRLEVSPRGINFGRPVLGIALVVVVGLARHFILGPGLRL